MKKLDNDGQATVTGNNHSMLVLKILKKSKKQDKSSLKGMEQPHKKQKIMKKEELKFQIVN